eukprot:jgi/Bigna1/81945/fgenesh1_pg.86_\
MQVLVEATSYLLVLLLLLLLLLLYVFSSYYCILITTWKRGTKEKKSRRSNPIRARKGVLPIAFINTLFRADIDKLDHATALTAVFLLGWSPLFWSLGKHLMSGGEGGGGAIDKQLQQGGGGKNADDNDGGGGRSGLLRSAVVRAVSRVLKIMELVKEMILTNPPIAGCLLGVLIGVVHPIRDLFLSNAATGYVAPLGMIANGMRNMALGSIPLSVLVLAGTMAQKRPPPPPPLANKSSDAAVEVVGKAYGRFLLVPFTSLLAVNFAVKTGLIANDPILIFVLLLQSAMPSAQNSVTILQVLDKPAEAQKVARLLLKIYAMSIVPWHLEEHGHITARATCDVGDMNEMRAQEVNATHYKIHDMLPTYAWIQFLVWIFRIALQVEEGGHLGDTAGTASIEYTTSSSFVEDLVLLADIIEKMSVPNPATSMKEAPKHKPRPKNTSPSGFEPNRAAEVFCLAFYTVISDFTIFQRLFVDDEGGVYGTKHALTHIEDKSLVGDNVRERKEARIDIEELERRERIAVKEATTNLDAMPWPIKEIHQGSACERKEKRRMGMGRITHLKLTDDANVLSSALRPPPSRFWVGNDAMHGGGGPAFKNLPFVTITTAVRGQWHLERNTWLNVRYSTYPPNRMELLIVDSSPVKSLFFERLHNMSKTGSIVPAVTYLHFPPPVKIYQDMWVGKARILMTNKAKGDIIIRFICSSASLPLTAHGQRRHLPAGYESRDFIEKKMIIEKQENYMAFVPRHGHRAALRDRTARKKELFELVALGKNRAMTMTPGGTFHITGMLNSAGVGGHHIAYKKKMECRWHPTGSSEEIGVFGCAQGRKTFLRIEEVPLNVAMIKVTNPISITNQIFYVAREIFTPLSTYDWYNYLKASQDAYDVVHRLLRPSCVRAENWRFTRDNPSSSPVSYVNQGQPSPPRNPTFATAATQLRESKQSYNDSHRRADGAAGEEAEEMEESLPPLSKLFEESRMGPLTRTKEQWQEVFRYYHAPCVGFSRLPGFRIEERIPTELAVFKEFSFANNLTTHPFESEENGRFAMEGERRCCNICKKHAKCTVFEYEVASGTCRTAFRPSEEPCKKKAQCGLQFLVVAN